jgi:hypothetical protein
MIAAIPVSNNMIELGSGTDDSKDKLSRTNDVPPGSAVILTTEMPPAKATCNSSFGLLPLFPEDNSLLLKSDVAVPTKMPVVLKASKVSSAEYVKYPLRFRTGVSKVIESGPPSSNTAVVPDCGGNSNSFSVIPAVIAVVLAKVRPENWVVIGVLSTITEPPGKVSKSMVLTTPAIDDVRHNSTNSTATCKARELGITGIGTPDYMPKSALVNVILSERCGSAPIICLCSGFTESLDVDKLIFT